MAKNATCLLAVATKGTLALIFGMCVTGSFGTCNRTFDPSKVSLSERLQHISPSRALWMAMERHSAKPGEQEPDLFIVIRLGGMSRWIVKNQDRWELYVPKDKKRPLRNLSDAETGAYQGMAVADMAFSRLDAPKGEVFLNVDKILADVPSCKAVLVDDYQDVSICFRDPKSLDNTSSFFAILKEDVTLICESDDYTNLVMKLSSSPMHGGVKSPDHIVAPSPP